MWNRKSMLEGFGENGTHLGEESNYEEGGNSKIQQNEQNCREMWDTIKHSNIQVKGVPEREGNRTDKI